MQDIDEILAIFTTYEETNKNLYDEVNKLSNEVIFTGFIFNFIIGRYTQKGNCYSKS
jgi:hypothetical protein